MARYFLYLAPDYQDKMYVLQVRMNEPGPGRRHLVDEVGVDENFLDWAEPGDFYEVESERLVIRLGRRWADDPQDDEGTPT